MAAQAAARNRIQRPPTASSCRARRGGDALEREQPGHAEPEREAAVHVGPCRHQQHAGERRRAAALDGADEAAHPGEDHRQDEDVRARQQVRHRQHRGDEGDRKRDRPAQARGQMLVQDGEGGADRQRGDEDDAAPAARRIGGEEDQLRQPIPWRSTARPKKVCE